MADFEAFRVAIPFVTPLRTAAAKASVREVIVIRVELDGAVGYGEAAPWPGQTRGTIDDAWRRVTGAHTDDDAPGDPVRAAFELAALDAMARRHEQPLWAWWGGTAHPIAATAAVGIFGSTAALLDHVAGLVAAGHRAIKLKVAPGNDLEPLRAVLAAFPRVAVGVDANGAYRDLGAAVAVARLGPAYFEQPFPPDEVELGASLRHETGVPVLADESIWTEEDAKGVLAREAADGVVIKPGRLGVPATRRLLQWAQDLEIPVKVSGLFETSIGRAHNLAVAARPEVTLVDFTPTATHLVGDVVTDPWTLHEGFVTPRRSAGIGVSLAPALLERYTTARHRGTWPLSVQEVTGAGEDQ